MVEKAIRKINLNYPTETTQLEGFLRAIMKKTDSVAYITEGIYLIEKEGYDKISKKGKVMLFTGRSLEIIELNHSFYGGHHITHVVDFVHSRPSFINESKTKQ